MAACIVLLICGKRFLISLIVYQFYQCLVPILDNRFLKSMIQNGSKRMNPLKSYRVMQQNHEQRALSNNKKQANEITTLENTQEMLSSTCNQKKK